MSLRTKPENDEDLSCPSPSILATQHISILFQMRPFQATSSTCHHGPYHAVHCHHPPLVQASVQARTASGSSGDRNGGINGSNGGVAAEKEGGGGGGGAVIDIPVPGILPLSTSSILVTRSHESLHCSHRTTHSWHSRNFHCQWE